MHHMVARDDSGYVPAAAQPTIDVSETARFLGCSAKHVRDLLNRGDLPGVKLGKVWRLPRAQVYALVGFDPEGARAGDE